jgi:hypothetical protein
VVRLTSHHTTPHHTPFSLSSFFLSYTDRQTDKTWSTQWVPHSPFTNILISLDQSINQSDDTVLDSIFLCFSHMAESSSSSSSAVSFKENPWKGAFAVSGIMLTLVTYGILQVTTTFSPSSSPSNIHHTFFILLLLLLLLNQYCFLTLHLFAISIYHNYRINACTYIHTYTHTPRYISEIAW